MVELPGRSTFESDDRAGPDDEEGWGSPVLPPEYGSLRAVQPPTDKDGADQAKTADRGDGSGEQRWAVTSLLRRIQGDGATGGLSRVLGGGRTGDASSAPGPSRLSRALHGGSGGNDRPGDPAPSRLSRALGVGPTADAQTGAPGPSLLSRALGGGFSEEDEGADSGPSLLSRTLHGEPPADDDPVGPDPGSPSMLAQSLEANRADDESPSRLSRVLPGDQAAADGDGETGARPALSFASLAASVANRRSPLDARRASAPDEDTPDGDTGRPGPADTTAMTRIEPDDVRPTAGFGRPAPGLMPGLDAAVPLFPPEAPVTVPAGPPVVAPDGPVVDPIDEALPVTALPPGRIRRRARRPMRIRSRATIRHIDVLTVLRVSLMFWLVILVAFVVASVLLWVSADAFGVLPSIEKSARTLFSLKTFKLHVSTVAFYTGGVGVVLAIAGTIANVLFALMYNLIADVVGGVRVELESLQTE
ncbi:MAG TPA: DUF3566 domain-containing protein [Acidimicrobiales bacterium]|jgi:hypothetical protein|nr:DUF3566 domain-containing protein [Acidimicrobiales bacterium]